MNGEAKQGDGMPDSPVIHGYKDVRRINQSTRPSREFWVHVEFPDAWDEERAHHWLLAAADAFRGVAGPKNAKIVVTQKLITHTYTAPSGAVVIVDDVPAESFLNGDADEEIAYTGDVAGRLYDIITSALGATEPKGVARVSYDAYAATPSSVEKG